jgi:hypothetical protein
MTAIPTKLYEAFEKIRLGKVEEGTRLFDRIDGFDPVKSIVLAELSYFRHDWKRAVLFLRDFLESEQDLETVRYFMSDYKGCHFRVFLLCTCLLDSWTENRSSLQQLGKQYNKPPFQYRYQQTISLISDPENTKRLLLESRPELKKEGKIDMEYLEGEVKQEQHKRNWKHRSFDYLIREAYSKASTENHIVF